MASQIRLLLLAPENGEGEELAAGLSRGGYSPLLISHPMAAMAAWAKEKLEAAVLGLALSRSTLEEGGRLVKRLKEGGARPCLLLILPEQLSQWDPSLGDDFVLWRGEPEEVAARVRQVLWGPGRGEGSPTTRCGELSIDPGGSAG